jgi:hypothetical protein
MEMVTVNLLREGVNKHKARELAEHFYGLAPAQPAPVQEPVGEVIGTNASFGKIKDVKTIKWLVEPLPAGTKLYTTPPAAQRQWVGMRNEQFVDVAYAIAPRTVIGLRSEIPVWIVEYGRSIEAKLKEKNT